MLFFFFSGWFLAKRLLKINGKIRSKILLLMGEKATSVSKEGFKETPDQRIELYQKNIPNLTGKKLKGRNVLPYESTEDFVKETINFCQSFTN